MERGDHILPAYDFLSRILIKEEEIVSNRGEDMAIGFRLFQTAEKEMVGLEFEREEAKSYVTAG